MIGGRQGGDGVRPRLDTRQIAGTFERSQACVAEIGQIESEAVATGFHGEHVRSRVTFFLPKPIGPEGVGVVAMAEWSGYRFASVLRVCHWEQQCG